MRNERVRVGEKGWVLCSVCSPLISSKKVDQTLPP